MKRKYTASDWYMSIVILISGWVWIDTGNFLSGLILFGLLWLIGIPFRAGAWATNRLNSRPCSVCGNRVPNGQTQCGSCGTDFRLR